MWRGRIVRSSAPHSKCGEAARSPWVQIPPSPPKSKTYRVQESYNATMKNQGFHGQPYGIEWYKNRAFKSLEQIDDGVWDYSDSVLVYIGAAEEDYESIQQIDSPYYKLVTKPERSYLENIASTIADELPDESDFIDLGPGTEHKEQFLFDALKRQKKHFIYKPVDISNKFLGLATDYARDQGIVVDPILSPFEELATKLKKPGRVRFVSLGLTYSNYSPHKILNLLKSITGAEGLAFINSQIRDRIDMDKLVSMYTKDGYVIMKTKLSLLGLNPDEDITSHYCDDGIRLWCALRNSTSQLKQIGIMPGTKLLVLQSLRPTSESLQQDIADVFPRYRILDTNEPFVGAILKT